MVAMRILQLVVEGAGFYERKCQSIDAESLPCPVVTCQWKGGEFSLDGARVTRNDFLREADDSDVVHVYSAPEIPAAPLKGLRTRYVSRGAPAGGRFRWMSAPPAPARRLGPEEIPEAVADEFRTAGSRAPITAQPRRFVVGTYGPGRRDVRRMCESAVVRLARFRDDIDWDLYDDPPSADAMKQIDAWIDPTPHPDDLDGMVAEAQSVGIITIASRTPVNQRRLADGSAGFMVPPDDPNELVHALMNALFRPEMTLPKLSTARAAEWYAPERRAAALVAIYERVIDGERR